MILKAMKVAYYCNDNILRAGRSVPALKNNSSSRIRCMNLANSSNSGISREVVIPFTDFTAPTPPSTGVIVEATWLAFSITAIANQLAGNHKGSSYPVKKKAFTT